MCRYQFSQYISLYVQISSNYEACGVLLSNGNLLVWFGVLRYLSFFEKYNVSTTGGSTM